MSDTSFDTSAADTLTSGLSLGQFIKNVAEESQPPERWYELKPTVEKEWHTLQEEPSIREAAIDDEITQNPLSDISAVSTKQGAANPVASLIKHSEKQKHHELPQREKRVPKSEALLELCTPLKVTQRQPNFSKNANADKLSSDYFVTPAISHQVKPHVGSYSFSKTPTSSLHHQLPSYGRNKEQLSAQDISSLLEKDDSLAQRVKDLLEDNASIRSEASDQTFPKSTAKKPQSIPALLQQKSDTEQPEKQRSSTTGSDRASEPCQDEHIVLSDASLGSANDAKAFNHPDDMLATLNLFSDSGFNAGNLTCNSVGAGDALESLNASRGTEYGELPDSVDIPKDIVNRLQNMRLISQQSQNEPIPKPTNVSEPNVPESSSATNIIPVTTYANKPIVNPSVQPISGDVKYYVGSNPTTPQFPIEEEKLKQLQSYIEKKTGQPTVSPLVAGTDLSTNDQLLQNKVSTSTSVATSTKLLDAVSTSFPPTSVSSAGTDSLQTITSITRQELITSSSAKDCALSGGSKVNPLHFDSSQRCDPEGMSPPVNTNALPLASSKPVTSSVKIGTSSIFPPPNVSGPEKVEDDSYLSDNLTDESLLARIKSALSDSFAQRSFSSQLDKSDASLSSSIDSLAAHVKALLKEEVPKLLPVEEQETSNLSEVIENFEQTELWKFVAQFMPSASVPYDKSLPQILIDDASLPETIKDEDTMTESTLENSILERIRAEIRKSSFYTEPDTVSPSKNRKEPSPERENIVERPKPSQVPVVATRPSVITKPNELITAQTSNLHVIDEETPHVDPIPGIPDFSPSVLQQSSPSAPFMRSTQPRSEPHVKSAWPERNFSDYKQSAKAVITNQLSRAAQRDFDVSLTPARLQASVRKSSATKDDDYLTNISSNSIEATSLRTASAPSSARSAYFDKPDESASRLGNRSLDVEVQSRISPSAGAGRSSFADIESTHRTTPSKSISCQTMHSETTPVTDKSKNKSLSVTPMMSCGVPSSSKHVTLQEPHRSAPSSYFHQRSSFERRRSPYSSERFSKSRSYDGSPKKSASPLRNRVTVHDWLKSPQGKRTLEKQKHLPTFDELMEEEMKEERKKEELQVNGSKYLLNRDMNRQPSDLRSQTADGGPPSSSHKTSPRALFVEKSLKKSDFEKSSLRPQMDDNDSYQQVSFNTPGLPTAASRASLRSDESDVNLQRRVINHRSSDSEPGVKFARKMPRSVKEFEAMDEQAQKEFLRHILNRVTPQKRSSISSFPPKAPSVSSSYSGSMSSNQAVCDSDSTEYCDLPSTRPPTAFDTSNPSVMSLDEVKAEKIMKKLMDKIKRQKEQERKKITQKRGAATSSTPQKRRPPLPVPEASSIASTDTDAGGKYIIKVRDNRRRPGHKKVAYIEEISESEPTTYVRVKRKTKKSDHVPGRIVLHDRSVQTVASQESLASQTSIVDEKSPAKQEKGRKTSKAIQTNGGADENDKENMARVKRVTPSQQRFSSFFVDFKNEKKPKTAQAPEERPVYHKGVAWYEPFRYEPCWMQRAQREREDVARGLVRLTLQEALANQHPEFISRSRERQRRITIHSDERRLQEIWEEERQRLFGARNDTKPKKRSEPTPRRNLQLTRKQIVAETREKYEQLPEVVKKREEERRKREYASNRTKAQLYKKKIQNRVLGRYVA